MNFLPKPTDDPLNVYQTCISNVRDEGFKARLTSIESTVLWAANQYDQLASKAELYQFAAHSGVGKNVSRDELISIYTDRMAKKGGPGRSLYNKLKSLAVRDICPLCNVKQVAQLDHYLPKSIYPVFSVLPCNLIPTCRDCNTIKLDAKARNAESQTLHPYYDNISGQQWLAAEVVPTIPASVVFRVAFPVEWNQLIASRVVYHFKMFELDRLYSIQAANEIVGIRQALQVLHDAGGYSAVLQHLSTVANGWVAASKNCWQAASYVAMCKSHWFCSGGFGKT